MENSITIGLTGNPNTGKSTLFNALTGAKQRVGNWPGKTIDKKEGYFLHKNKQIKIVDLPGAYSLTPYTEEEKITSNYIAEKKADIIIQVLDAQNIERNLIFTTQLLENKIPLVLAISMVDLIEKEGLEIDIKKLSQNLKIPIIPIDAKNKKGIKDLIDAAIEKSKKNTEITTDYTKTNDHKKLTNLRNNFIKNLTKDIFINSKKNKTHHFSEKTDHILTNKYWGIPIFLFIAWLMFQITFKFSEPIIGLIETLFGFIGENIRTFLTSIQIPSLIISFIVDGIIGGVGGVLVFIPTIGILFFLLAILEDSGYMARVAYIMDRLMNKIGLHGKAFIPIIMGFGCNVPGIMATRTLESKKDRLVAILINPFMSCSARLPVYILFTGAFFSANQGWVIFSLYFLGIFIAIATGLILKNFILDKKYSPFIIELPPYRQPSLKGLFLHAWSKVFTFIKKAGTIILAFSVLIWSLASFPVGVKYGSQESFAGKIGTTISPIFEPLGFGDWQSSVALTFGFVAKEVVVSTFGTLYGVNNSENPNENLALKESLQKNFTPLSAYSFMVFVLLYIPCIATLATVRKETNSWKFPLLIIVYTSVIAWISSFLVYQVGKLITTLL